MEIVVYQNEQTKISLLIVQLFLELSTTFHRSEFAHAAADGLNILEIFLNNIDYNDNQKDEGLLELSSMKAWLSEQKLEKQNKTVL